MKLTFGKLTDKDYHVYAGVAIAMLTGFLTYYFTPIQANLACIIGLLIGTATGVVKELVWDKLLGKGTCSLWDAIATGYGSALGAIVLRIIYAVLLGEGV